MLSFLKRGVNMFNFSNRKTKRIVCSIIAGLIVLAMVLGVIFSAV